ncbi:MAG: tRNA (N(6)-L-threonylcarbamoyladenosine(37)-C(2))-methylthiotransferase [Candidatus Verstraetearchaeota archaeon]|nr:tRNA (N(6)-L-threonylcarbamoyladenosine(37)-C(2))-methylthiotransferase [Candidatus Verstraetearchaeota archaeon]
MKVYIKTFGCFSNKAESETVAKLLEATGFKLARSLDDAGAVVVNTCTVRGETELRVLKFLTALSGRRVVVTGCMAAVQPTLISKHAPNFSIVSPHNLPSIPLALQSESRSVILRPHEALPEPAPFRSGVKYTIAISRGCLGSCSYCIVRLARGHLRSLPHERVIPFISNAVKGGAWEIRLTAQDTGVYGRDTGTDLPALLNGVTAIDGDFRVRVGMFNPSSVCNLIERLIRSYQSDKIYKFVHIPVQSGSNKVLCEMKRGYDAKSFKKIVNAFRSAFPNLVLFTDVIVGYPDETDQDFEETCNLIRATRPDKTHIARFSPRPHTPASSLKQVAESVKKCRSEVLTRLTRGVQTANNSRWVGWVVDATVVDIYRRGGMIARTDEYKTIAISKCERSMLGKRFSIRVHSCTPFYLKGTITRR